jgi:hypothetical protein
VPEIRSDFSISKKAAAKKSNSNDDVGGAFKMFVVGELPCPKRWRKQKDR